MKIRSHVCYRREINKNTNEKTVFVVTVDGVCHGIFKLFMSEIRFSELNHKIIMRQLCFSYQMVIMGSLL